MIVRGGEEASTGGQVKKQELQLLPRSEKEPTLASSGCCSLLPVGVVGLMVTMEGQRREFAVGVLQRYGPILLWYQLQLHRARAPSRHRYYFSERRRGWVVSR